MSIDLNRVTLAGQVARDPAIATTASGSKVAFMSLKTTHCVERKEGVEEEITWHRLTAYDDIAEFVAENVKRGARIYVEGRLVCGSFEKHGVTIPMTEIALTYLMLIPSRERIVGEVRQ